MLLNVIKNSGLNFDVMQLVEMVFDKSQKMGGGIKNREAAQKQMKL